jgi:hypothetical protein
LHVARWNDRCLAGVRLWWWRLGFNPFCARWGVVCGEWFGGVGRTVGWAEWLWDLRGCGDGTCDYTAGHGAGRHWV